MRLVVSCHVEPDKVNPSGCPSVKLEEPQQSYKHIPYLLSFLQKVGLPMTLCLMVGGRASVRLLEVIAQNKANLLPSSELAVHFHFEEYDDSRRQWETTKPDRASMKKYCDLFAEKLSAIPTTTVFHHWLVDEEAIKMAEEVGIAVDGSYAPYRQGERFMIKSPFRWGGILEVPVASDGNLPLNPFVSPYHKRILERLITKYRLDDVVLHFAFHSYDIYDFNQGNIITEAEEFWKKLLIKGNRYNLQFTTLNALAKLGYEASRQDTIFDTGIMLRAKLGNWLVNLRRRLR